MRSAVSPLDVMIKLSGLENSPSCGSSYLFTFCDIFQQIKSRGNCVFLHHKRVSTQARSNAGPLSHTASEHDVVSPMHLTEFLIYRVIQNDGRGFNNLSYTIHLR